MDKERQREQKIINLIESKKETEFVDFKQEFYHKEKTGDLIKDIVSFANVNDNEDKFIIIGVDNDNYNLIDVDYDKVRDISEINQLLNEYCEPFINVELFRFTYNCKKLLALIISGNIDRPYIIKKEYNNKGSVLREGEIRIRHGATNFIANRNDLDEIYANRQKIDLVVKDNAMKFINLRHGTKKEQVCCLQILIDNSSDKSFIFHNGNVNWQYSDTSTGRKIAYIEDQADRYAKELLSISEKPLQVQAHTQYQKSLFVSISDGMIDIIRQKEIEKEKLKISINLKDASDRVFKFETLIDSVKFELS